MCGRYRLSRRKQILAEHFDTNFDDLDWEPRYNIAPTQSVPVIRRHDGTNRAALLRWGLIPSWAADSTGSARSINARSETAAIKPSFKEPLRAQRCLIPADAFYEWQRQGKARQPFCFEVGDSEIFAFAGLWDKWKSPDGSIIESCAILTTTANGLLNDVHDRMPVILDPRNYGSWLDPSVQDAARMVNFLKPFDPKLMRRYPVSTRVNIVANDDRECSVPVDLVHVQSDLFS